MTVKVPEKVAESLDKLHRELHYLSEDDRNMMCLMIPGIQVHGYAEIVKRFAKKEPTLYIKALANGYEPETKNTREQEVAQMITAWLDKPYVNDEKTDIENFAKMVVKYFEVNG